MARAYRRVRDKCRRDVEKKLKADIVHSVLCENASPFFPGIEIPVAINIQYSGLVGQDKRCYAVSSVIENIHVLVGMR